MSSCRFALCFLWPTGLFETYLDDGALSILEYNFCNFPSSVLVQTPEHQKLFFSFGLDDVQRGRSNYGGFGFFLCNVVDFDCEFGGVNDKGPRKVTAVFRDVTVYKWRLPRISTVLVLKGDVELLDEGWITVMVLFPMGMMFVTVIR
jgi:hypothetical protein